MGKLGDLNKRIQESQANQGYGQLGRWPFEGEGDVRKEIAVALVSIKIDEEAKFEYGKRGAKQAVDACLVQFGYKWIDCPDGALEFQGAPMLLPYDVTALPEDSVNGKQQTRCSMSEARLKGSLCALLGTNEIPDVEAALNTVKDTIVAANAGNTILQINLLCTIRSSSFKRDDGSEGKFVNKEEFIRGVITG